MKKIKLRKYRDDRGSLVENTVETVITDSKHFFISKSKPNSIRGNHFHKRKSEWFYLIQGVCKVYTIDLMTNKKEEFVIDEGDSFIFNFGQNVAHAFKNIGEKEMILMALVNEVHNQSDPDTYYYKVI